MDIATAIAKGILPAPTYVVFQTQFEEDLKNGEIIPEKLYKYNKELYSWLKEQITKKEEGQLSEINIKLLDNIGIAWDLFKEEEKVHAAEEKEVVAKETVAEKGLKNLKAVLYLNWQTTA